MNKSDSKIFELKSLYMNLYNNKFAFESLIETLNKESKNRKSELKILDNKRLNNPNWYLDKKMIGMTMYTNLFSENLINLKKKIPYLKSIGITYLHLMPLLKMPKKNNDGGYAVSDFTLVDKKFGTNNDLETLIDELRENQISLCLDFVINHTSDYHEWAKKAKKGIKEYQDMYFCFDNREIPDEYDKIVPQVFPSSAPGNFTFSKEMNKWVMTTFYPYQWDLNFKNPIVFNKMIEAFLFLSNKGVQIFRLDAIPYIWKEKGTNCRNLKEVHQIIRMIRLIVEIVCPSVILKGEVVMAPKELISYFGTKEKRECHLLYNTSTMVNLWSSLASEDVRLLKHQLEIIFSLPKNCNFINYLRCHDDIGWGLDEDYEKEIGINPFLHKKYLYNFFSGNFKNSFAKGELYNFDEKSLDARSCGTTASLCGLENSNKREQKLALKRILLLHATLYSIKGFPLLNSGDEIGQLNDYSYHNNKDLNSDSRYLHRSPFDWKKAKEILKFGTNENIIFSNLNKLTKIKSENICFDSSSHISTWDTHNDKVIAIYRKNKDEELICISNFSNYNQSIYLTYFNGIYEDLFSKKRIEPGLKFILKPYEYIWAKAI